MTTTAIHVGDDLALRVEHTPRGVLRAARAILADEARWVRRDLAHDGQDRVCDPQEVPPHPPG